MLAIAILAAGKGTRMKSSLPKVLQKLAGKTLIKRVVDSCNLLSPTKSLVVIGHKGECVKKELSDLSNLEYVSQNEQKGTGHAVQQLIDPLSGFKGDLLVLNGDVPLLRYETIEGLIQKHRKTDADVTLISAKVKDPKGYGRVFLGKNDKVIKIVEDRDCNIDEKTNHLTNSGIYCFKWEKLRHILPYLTSKNNQNELYITDAIEMLGLAINYEIQDPGEVQGVNDREQLAICESYIQENLRREWMKKGVSFTDLQSCTLSEDCCIGKDTLIEPQTHLRGNCSIGEGCKIGPGSFIEDCIIGDNVKVINSVLTGAKVRNNVQIGPFSHIRPDSNIYDNCKVGNFVEIKKSSIDKDTKINHLTYIGDSQLGKDVNIGAGTITANYDGISKHKTIIGNNSKTGANSVLVAPITLGENVTVAAGATLTKDVPSGSLAISRSKQYNKKGWNEKNNG